MTSCEEWSESRGRAIIAEQMAQDGATLPVLHALQHAFGHIPQEAVRLIAEALNLTRAEVHGIVTFYRDFRGERPGRHVLKLCRAEACQSVGAEDLALHVRQQLRVGWGETTTDGKVTLEAVFCLGLCACGPAAMLDGKVFGRLDRVRLTELLDGAVGSI